MTTAPRHDLYAHIHKALRHALGDTLLRLGRADVNDPDELGAALLQLDRLLTLLNSHVMHENEFIHPALESRQRGSSEAIAVEHDDHLLALAALRDEAAALRARPSAAHAHQLYRRFAAFVAEQFQHMEVEESRHNERLWAHYSDAELEALHGRLVAHVTPQTMTEVLRWMLPALSPQERALVIAGLPPQAQAPVLGSARALLDDHAWTKLCRALGQAPVPGLMAA